MSLVPAKIVVGLSLDLEESKELLSWAVTFLARPNDTVVALHVVEEEATAKEDRRKGKSNKWKSNVKHQIQIRQAKALVITIAGEFIKVCQSNQVNIEAKISSSRSVGRGLISEAKGIAANYVVLAGRNNNSNRLRNRIRRYVFDHVPENCSLVMLGNRENCQEVHDASLRFAEKNTQISNNVLSDDEKYVSKRNKGISSPYSVLDAFEEQSQGTEDDRSCFEESSIALSPTESEIREQCESRKPMSPFKRMKSFFFPSPDCNRRKGSDDLFFKQKQQPQIKCFSYAEIANSTNNFHPDNIVGHGGYSEVYRGDLDEFCSIAVKCLSKHSSNAKKEIEFLTELGIMGHVNHPNTASLLGCCVENGLFLIFKFYPNGTLSSALHGEQRKFLEWPMRYKIALGIARGLHYLHKCCKHRIIHRDIKASNVLLGPDYEPQISDFGLAKWLPNKGTHHAVIPIEGTFGYMAPEYFLHGIVDEKIDVYAFGILLLEIITGREPVNPSNQSLLLWAKPLMETGKLIELADPNLQGEFDTDQFHRMVLTASFCVRQSSMLRPSMTEVLELLTSREDYQGIRRIPKFASDDMDDYSSVFGYDLPADFDDNYVFKIACPRVRLPRGHAGPRVLR